MPPYYCFSSPLAHSSIISHDNYRTISPTETPTTSLSPSRSIGNLPIPTKHPTQSPTPNPSHRPSDRPPIFSKSSKTTKSSKATSGKAFKSKSAKHSKSSNHLFAKSSKKGHTMFAKSSKDYHYTRYGGVGYLNEGTEFATPIEETPSMNTSSGSGVVSLCTIAASIIYVCSLAFLWSV